MQSIVEVLVLFVTMNPYVSQGMVAAAVEGIGVAFGQRYLEGRDRIDLLRCFRAMLNGFFIGMLLRYWYGLIQDHVLGSTKLISALAQVAVHRYFFSHFADGILGPIWQFIVFYFVPLKFQVAISYIMLFGVLTILVEALEWIRELAPGPGMFPAVQR